MTKRPAPHDGSSRSHKKHKHDHDRRPHANDRLTDSNGQDAAKPRSAALSHEDAMKQLPPRTSESGPVNAFTPFSVSTDLPDLPEVQQPNLAAAVFKHRSTLNYHRSSAAGSSSAEDLSYERLEFLGDAYIELIATRLIFERFSNLTSGQQSQLREVLVKNETLSEYSKAYGFERQIDAGGIERMIHDGKQKGNKGFNKVLGDVFEAYVAALILSDAENGFAVAEKWLTTLWAPKLVEVSSSDASYAAAQALVQTPGSTDRVNVYDPTAKTILQKRILADGSMRLSYEPYRQTLELKGDQLGQNRHFIALYLTGYGYERKVLGKGEGKNKVEAGNWAAIQAMHGESKDIVDECEAKLKAIRAERAAKKASSLREENGEKKE